MNKRIVKEYEKKSGKKAIVDGKETIGFKRWKEYNYKTRYTIDKNHKSIEKDFRDVLSLYLKKKEINPTKSMIKTQLRKIYYESILLKTDELWWFPKNIDYSQFVNDSEYAEKIRKRSKYQIQEKIRDIVKNAYGRNILLEKYGSEIDPYKHTENYGKIIKKVESLFNKFSKEHSFKEITDAFRYSSFWKRLIFGDIDVDYIGMFGNLELAKKGILRYHLGHTGNYLFEHPKDHQSEREEMLYVFGSKKFIKELEDLLGQIKFTPEVRDSFIFVTTIESTRQAIFRRYIFGNMPRKEALTLIRESLESKSNIALIIH